MGDWLRTGVDTAGQHGAPEQTDAISRDDCAGFLRQRADRARAGAVFHKGKLLERPTDITTPAWDGCGDQWVTRVAGE